LKQEQEEIAAAIMKKAVDAIVTSSEDESDFVGTREKLTDLYKKQRIKERKTEQDSEILNI